MSSFKYSIIGEIVFLKNIENNTYQLIDLITFNKIKNKWKI